MAKVARQLLQIAKVAKNLPSNLWQRLLVTFDRAADASPKKVNFCIWFKGYEDMR